MRWAIIGSCLTYEIGQIILKVEKHLVNEITMPWLKPTIVTEWCELLGHKNGNGIKGCRL